MDCCDQCIVLPQAKTGVQAGDTEVEAGSTEVQAGNEARETVGILIIYLISLYICCRYRRWLVLYLHRLHRLLVQSPCPRLHCHHHNRQDTTFRIILSPIIHYVTLAGDDAWYRNDASSHDGAPADDAGGTCYIYIYIYIHISRMYFMYWYAMPAGPSDDDPCSGSSCWNLNALTCHSTEGSHVSTIFEVTCIHEPSWCVYPIGRWDDAEPASCELRS